MFMNLANDDRTLILLLFINISYLKVFGLWEQNGLIYCFLNFNKKIVKFTIFIPLNKVQLYKNLNEKAGKFITDIKKKRHRQLR